MRQHSSGTRRPWLVLIVLCISLLVMQPRSICAQTQTISGVTLRLDGAVLHGSGNTSSADPKGGSLQLPGRGTKLLVHNSLAVVAIAGGRVVLVDATSAVKLRVTAELELGVELTDISISEGSLRLASVSGSVTMLPLRTITELTEPPKAYNESCQPDRLNEGEVRLNLIRDRLLVMSRQMGEPASCSQVALPSMGKSSAVRKRVAYVALIPSGIAIVDLSDPSSPRLDRVEERGRRIESMRLVDDILYVLDSASMMSRHQPNELQPGSAEGRPLSSEGVPQINLQRRPNPTSPETPEPSSSPFVAFAETSRYFFELQKSVLIRRSRGTADTETVTMLVLPKPGAGIVAADSLAIVALRPEGLLVIDTSEPDLMKIIQVQTSSRLRSLTRVDDSVYIRTSADNPSVESLLKIHCYFGLKMEERLAAPSDGKSEAAPGPSNARLAFEMRNERLLFIREVASIPKECSSIRLPSAGGQVVARSGVAYVTLLGGGLSVIEGVDTMQPRLVSTIEAGRILTDPQVRDDSLWIRDRGANRYRYSLQNPLQPRLAQVVASLQSNPGLDLDGARRSPSTDRETRKGAGMLLTSLGGLGAVVGIGFVVAGGFIGATTFFSDALTGMKTSEGTKWAKTGGIVAGASLPVVSLGVLLWVTGAISD